MTEEQRDLYVIYLLDDLYYLKTWKTGGPASFPLICTNDRVCVSSHLMDVRRHVPKDYGWVKWDLWNISEDDKYIIEIWM